MKNLEKRRKFYTKKHWKATNLFMLSVFFGSIFFLLATSSIDAINDIDINIKHHDASLDNDEIKFTYDADNFHINFEKNHFHDILYAPLSSEINIPAIPKFHTIFYSFDKSNIELNNFQPWTRSIFS